MRAARIAWFTLVLLTLPATIACSRRPATAGTAGAPNGPHETGRGSDAVDEPVPVHVGTIQLESWPLVLPITGSLEADERSTLGTKVAGRVTELSIDVGSVVKAGDPIAQIDEVDYRLRAQQVESLVRQARALLGLTLAGDDDTVDPENTAQVRLARAVLAEATAKRDRAVTLNEQGVLEDELRDEAVAAAKVAEERVQSALEDVTNRRGALEQRRAELELSRQQLADTSIKAPYDGVIVRRLAGRGDFVTVGTPIAVLVRVDPLRLAIEVPEHEAPKVKIGQAVEFTIEGDSTKYRAVVSRMPPELNPQNRSLIAEAEFANSATDGAHPLRAASFLQGAIVLDPNATALAAPAGALRTFAGVDRLLVVEDVKAKEVLVTVGRREKDRIEILSGVAAGARIILDPGNLSTGRPVRVVQ